MAKHYKDTFDKIDDDKRERILNAAVIEFSSKGFNSANINIISKNAGISIGSMYNYFSSKEDLFLTVVDSGYKLLEKALSDVDLTSGDIFDKFEKLLRAAQQYSKNYKELTQIYLDMTTEGLSNLSQRLSRKMETITAKFYQSLIVQAQEEGLVNKELDEYTTSFCLDNLILLLQFSYTNEYYRERMKIFAGEHILEDDERIIEGIMMFIRGALSPLNK